MTLLRVLHVINNLDNLGGAELSLLQLVTNADRHRFRHGVVALLKSNLLGGDIEAAGVDVRALDIRNGIGAALSRTGDLLRESRPDLIVGWLYYGNLAASLLGAVRQRPVVWNVRHSTHDLARSGRSTRMSLAFSTAAARQPRAIVYNSVDVARQHAARRMTGAWTEVIENGVDTRRFQPNEVSRARWRATLGAQRDTKVIGRFGRYHALKGYADLIAAFARIRVLPNALLVLGGTDVDASNEDLRMLIDAAGVRDQVRLLGERRDLNEILPALDLFVSTSHGESFPNVLAEAMACGVPCVATAVGASSRILGDVGWLVPPGDVPRIAATIDHALDTIGRQSSPVRERAMMHIARDFSLAAMVTRYEALFAALAMTN